jgi:plasmid stabilization system protein ParE
MKQLPVEVSPRAHDDIDLAHEWWAEHRSVEQADRWEKGVEKAILGLGTTYLHHSLAPENSRFPFEVRQLLFGFGRRATHRVLFTIRPDRVSVLTVQHVAQKPLGPDDLP